MISQLIIMALIAVLGSVPSVQSVNCTFEIIDDMYACQLRGQNIASEGDMLPIRGEHLPGMRNANVTFLNSDTTSTIEIFPARVIEQFVNLEMVNLVGNQMKNFSSKIINCNALNFVNLMTNKIEKVPSGIFQNCHLLTYLNLGDNRIDTIDPGAFNGTTLTSLFLMRNNIDVIDPAVFEPIPNVTTLDLSNSLFIEIPDDQFVFLPKLERLLLHNNIFETWNSTTLKNLPNLIELQLQSNRIERFEFPALDHLESLNLANNQFKNISDNAFSGLTALKSLYLDRNRIEILQEKSIRPIEQLRMLNVSYNQIKKIERELFLGASDLTFSSLGNKCYDSEITIENSADFEGRVAAVLETCLTDFAVSLKVNSLVLIAAFFFAFVRKL